VERYKTDSRGNVAVRELCNVIVSVLSWKRISYFGYLPAEPAANCMRLNRCGRFIVIGQTQAVYRDVSLTGRSLGARLAPVAFLIM
jgi:hypothetical protein